MTSTTTATTVNGTGSAAQRERRQRMLEATIELASQGGFEAVQMRAVAERADVALGTLYRYFPSKIHLLVTALGRQFAAAEAAVRRRAVPGDTPADRVIWVLKRTSRGLEADQRLAEALTRAFMFADASVEAEIRRVGLLLTQMITYAINPETALDEDPTEDEIAVARVIGDVWLSSLVAWVTGRSTPEETADHMDRAVHLILR
ncbi:MAG: TetR family transcriptional regulator [Nocardioides sp.]|jgi:AcrR family transcriptional regulator